MTKNEIIQLAKNANIELGFDVENLNTVDENEFASAVLDAAENACKMSGDLLLAVVNFMHAEFSRDVALLDDPYLPDLD